MIIKRVLYRFVRDVALPGLIALCMAAPGWTRASSILVLGDSISAAYGMSLEQGWVALMEQQLAIGGQAYRVVNASISGETSGGGLRRLPALLDQHRPQLVIIELGANDGLRGYPINRFRDNLTAMVKLSQDAGASVVLLPMEIPPNYGSRYTSDFRQSFPSVATATGAALAPFILEGIATDPKLMQEDGLHPRAEAQPRILENVMPSITDALEGS